MFFSCDRLGLLWLWLLNAFVYKGAADDFLSWLDRWLGQRLFLLAWLLCSCWLLFSSLTTNTINCLLKSLHVALQLHSDVVNSSIHAIHASM